MKFIDDAIKESEERMEEKAPKKISSDIDNDLIKLFKQNKVYFNNIFNCCICWDKYIRTWIFKYNTMDYNNTFCAWTFI